MSANVKKTTTTLLYSICKEISRKLMSQPLSFLPSSYLHHCFPLSWEEIMSFVITFGKREVQIVDGNPKGVAGILPVGSQLFQMWKGPKKSFCFHTLCFWIQNSSETCIQLFVFFPFQFECIFFLLALPSISFLPPLPI